MGRVADVALWSALVLIHAGVGGLELSRLEAWARSGVPADLSLQVAAILVVVAVALRTAQLPFHGWIIQVMEAPTPVSALLHAGVVNIGGVVLIRLAPFMASMTAAQLLLIGIGLVSMVVASLVALTRVSVKVALAWSTCAQMGFMLVQCGLGAWPLALLHLVAHSLYKAHAFLSAGSTVDRWRGRALHTPPVPDMGLVVGIAAVVVAASLGLLAVLHAAGVLQAGPSMWSLAVLVGLSVTPLMATRWSKGAAPAIASGVGSAVLIMGLVIVTHRLAMAILPAPVVSPLVEVVGWALVVMAVVVLFGVKTVLTLAPGSPVARWMWPWLFAGLHLDERVTRLTFLLWPPRLPPPSARAVIVAQPAAAGVSA